MSSGFSAQGWSRIPFIDGPLCDGCGTPFEYDLGEGVRCADCMAKPRAFSRGRAACLYDDASRGVILQLKHADRTDLAPMLARWISRSARDLLEDADAIAPVPLHRGRLLGRRYNQAAEIARPLSRLTGVPCLPDALVRVRATEDAGRQVRVGPAAQRRRRFRRAGWPRGSGGWQAHPLDR